MANIGSIIGGGFRLIMERPVTVAVWALIYVAFGLAGHFLMIQQTGAMLDPAALRSGAVSPFGFIGMAIPIWIASLLFYSVMMCAVFRAVLRPSESGFASLRIGMDELRMIGIILLLVVALIIVGVVAGLVLGVVLGGLFAATGGGAMAFLFSFLTPLALLCGIIFLWVRLSLIFSMSFVRRRIVIDDAWSITRGHFWMLFGAYLVIFIITVTLSMVAVWPFMSPYFAQLVGSMRNPAAFQAVQEQQVRQQLDMPLVTVILMTTLSSIVSTITLVLNAGATATATRELLLDDGEVLDDDVESTAAIFE